MASTRIITNWHDYADGARSAEVVVNRAEKINALDAELTNELAATFASLRTTDARVIVLTGAGDKAFIGGADINTLRGLNPNTARSYITSVHQVCQNIRDCAAPVVARINGYCLGAGLEIAAACDIRIAEADAVLGMPETKVGLPSVVEAALLPRLIGWGHTRWMLLTGENITAAKGADWGLIDVLAETGELDSAVDATVRSFLAAAPQAVRVQKALMRDWEQLSINDAITRGIDAFADCYAAGSEPQEYVEAFLAQRERAKRSRQ